MTAQPVPEQPAPQLHVVMPTAESRLASLHAQYADAKAEADAAAERLKTITDGIKAELRAAQGAAAPGVNVDRVELRSPYGPVLRLTRSERVTFDSRKFKVDNPHLYVQYAKFGEAWSLRVIAPEGGDE